MFTKIMHTRVVTLTATPLRDRITTLSVHYFLIIQQPVVNYSLLNVLFFLIMTEENVLCTPTSRDSYERVSHSGPTLPPGFPAQLLFPEGLSSIETLLTNIQVYQIFQNI